MKITTELLIRKDSDRTFLPKGRLKGKGHDKQPDTYHSFMHSSMFILFPF